MDDKENTAPVLLSGGGSKRASLSPHKSSRRGRSKSIGPGALDDVLDIENLKKDAKNRRKSAFVPATKSILTKLEDAEKAARRKTMVNRRVSFAPEATMHMWDIIECARDHTQSTDSMDSTRRASGLTRNASSSPAQSSDVEDNLDDDDDEVQSRKERKYRRSSGIPSMDFNNPDDIYSSEPEEASSDNELNAEDIDEEEEGQSASEDETGTAMSLVSVDHTVRSNNSASSTSSSARLEAALQQAAHMAGTRGIEYDEYGDMSMELAGEEITNAFQPWLQAKASNVTNTAAEDQENLNPFVSTFPAQSVADDTNLDQDEDYDDNMSMDVTQAVGRIVRDPHMEEQSSPSSEGDMDLTQAVGKITRQRKRRSTADTGSPAVELDAASRVKRRRSAMPRHSVGDEMDLTMAIGGIRKTESMARRTSNDSRRSSSGMSSAHDDATMEFTRAVGRITTAVPEEDESFDENEELTMEVTTALRVFDAQNTSNDTLTPQHATTSLPVPRVRSPAASGSDVEEIHNSGAEIAPATTSQVSASPSARRSSGVATRSQTTPVRDIRPDPTSGSPNDVVAYPTLPSQAITPPSTRAQRNSASRDQAPRTPVNSALQQQENHTADHAASLSRDKQQRLSTPQKPSTPQKQITPAKSSLVEDTRDLAESIKLMSTPRKEALKAVTPRKQSLMPQHSPKKPATPKGRPTPKSTTRARLSTSPTKSPATDLENLTAVDELTHKINLNDFLTQAGIKFMDLTTTKRRMTTAPTPSKARKNGGLDTESEEISLESSVVAAACTVPELELYQHACHELKRYTKEGKQMVAELEAETARETPPLMLAYINAGPVRVAELDANMRDMKTNARLRSKEMWYAWRCQLLEELMGGLQSIGENLIKDNEVILKSETLIQQTLPTLTSRHAALYDESLLLESKANAMSGEAEEEVQSTRDAITELSTSFAEKQLILDELRQRVQSENTAIANLANAKVECTESTKELHRLRESCRSVSVDEVAVLQDAVHVLEKTSGWTIVSSSTAPSTLTMAYRSQLQLFFEPAAFYDETSETTAEIASTPNAPIGLTYIADQHDQKQPLTTTLRFFLQLLQAACQALPQRNTKIADLLALVSDGWDVAKKTAEAERQLNLETLTESIIKSDERLDIISSILLPQVRTKVRVTFQINAEIGVDLQLHANAQPQVVVVYGEDYIEKNMTEFVRTNGGDSMDSWVDAVRDLQAKLILRGAKGSRKR